MPGSTGPSRGIQSVTSADRLTGSLPLLPPCPFQRRSRQPAGRHNANGSQYPRHEIVQRSQIRSGWSRVRSTEEPMPIRSPQHCICRSWRLHGPTALNTEERAADSTRVPGRWSSSAPWRPSRETARVLALAPRAIAKPRPGSTRALHRYGKRPVSTVWCSRCTAIPPDSRIPLAQGGFPSF